MLHSIEDIKKLRFKFLHEVYKAVQEKSENDGIDFVDGYEVGFNLSLNLGTVDNIVKYLSEEGLVEDLSMLLHDAAYGVRLPRGPPVRITHKGIKEVEDAVEKPNQHTEHFPPHSVTFNISGGQFTNSAFQVASKDSSQTITVINQNQSTELKEIVTELRRILVHPELPDDKKQELEAEVQTIESQSKSPKPKIQIIKDALSSAKSIVEEAAGVAGAAAPLITKIGSWLNGAT